MVHLLVILLYSSYICLDLHRNVLCKDNLSKNFILSSNECLFLIIIFPKDLKGKKNPSFIFSFLKQTLNKYIV